MTQAATMTEQVVEQFQRDRSEWFSAPVREILGEYETWRSGQGSAALPSEADDRLGPPELYGAVGVAMFKADLGGLRIDHKINFVGNAAYTAMRAATPTAPVQDDDAERLLFHELVKRGIDQDTADQVSQAVRAALASRLSPTPDTGLIEALRDLREHPKVAGCRPLADGPLRAIFDRADTALANAAPAQVERDARDPAIRRMLDEIEAKRAAMPPAERAELERRELEAQRESWIRAMAPCEHGVADWEECVECHASNQATKGDGL